MRGGVRDGPCRSRSRTTLVGDCKTSALVARDGSVDWLCWPRFDSEACFAALLGGREHGYWSLAPQEEARNSRNYRPNTLVLETEIDCPHGQVRLIDFMPVQAQHSTLVRIVVGVRGDVPMLFDAAFRFDYGHIRPQMRRADDELVAMAGPAQVVLRIRNEATSFTTMDPGRWTEVCCCCHWWVFFRAMIRGFRARSPPCSEI
jgi:GH15 family glucan-1,4-alpha-glucosidase